MTFARYGPSVLTALLMALLLQRETAAADGVPSFAQPSLSPDGREIVFVSGGSIWSVPAEGGDARLLVTQTADVARPLFSPDGRQLAYISNATGNGDIYVVSLDTGAIKRLTFDDASDRLDTWSVDGREIYFTTSGHNIGGGNGDIYHVSVDGETPMPAVSEKYQNIFYAAVHPDGHTLTFCVNGMASSQWWRHGHSHDDECELWCTDGHSHFTRLTDFGSKNLWPTYSPDGRILYFMSDRDGQENIWSLSVPRPTTAPTTQPAMGNAEMIVPPRQMTHFRDGRVLWPTLCRDGKTMVFERNLGIWKLNLTTGESDEVPIHLRGVLAETMPEPTTLTRSISELAVSHDGKKLAFVVKGQVFAALPGGGTAVRVTHTNAIESHVAWANDDRRLAYISTRDGPRHVYLYDFGDRTEKRLTDSAGNDSTPIFSADDSTLAFIRDGGILRLLDLPTSSRATTRPSTRPALRRIRTTAPTSRPAAERSLAGGLSFDRPPFDSGSTPFVWSAAGDWIAYLSGGAKGFRNVYLVPTDGSAKPRQVSFLANAENSSLAWNPDGSSLFFGSGQRTEDFQLARVDLVPQTAKFRDDQFSELFKEQPSQSPPNRSPRLPSGDESEGDIATQGVGPGRPTTQASTTSAATTHAANPTTAPPRHTTVNFTDIDERLSLLPVGVNVGEVTVSPDGKWLGFVGTTANRASIYVYPLDPLTPHPTARQLTTANGSPSFLQFAPEIANPQSGMRLYYLEGEQVHWISVNPGGTPQDVNISVDFELDFNRDKMLAFDQAWRFLNENFHDPGFHGVDWKAIRDRFAPHLAGARTAVEERRLLSLMIGELNASHMAAGGGEVKTSVARIGITFDPAEYARSGKLRIATVIPFGPAALSGVSTGQYLTSIDGASTAAPVNIDSLLDHKIDKEVTLTLAEQADGADHKDVKVSTISSSTERTLGYRQWVRHNREYVAKISNGRLGYVHIADMSQQALARLSTDLDARNENYDGVVVDIRNNDGGFVNGYALDVFSRKNYMSIEARGFPRETGRAALGQRYLGLPTILVTNRETLSDGEDFTEGYQAQGLGDTVGEPTAGWIIFTSGCTLIDGTQFRIPAETVYDINGQPMEMHPRPVNFAVSRAVNEPEQGKDSQLDEAVKRLLIKLKA